MQHPRDNSLRRLVKEVPKDEYHLRHDRRRADGRHRLEPGRSEHRGAHVGSRPSDRRDRACALHLSFLLWNLHLNAVPTINRSRRSGVPRRRGASPGVVLLHAAIAGENAPPTVRRGDGSWQQSQDAAVDLSITAERRADRRWQKMADVPGEDRSSAGCASGANAPLPHAAAQARLRGVRVFRRVGGRVVW